MINHEITYDTVIKRHLRSRFPLLKGQGATRVLRCPCSRHGRS